MSIVINGLSIEHIENDDPLNAYIKEHGMQVEWVARNERDEAVIYAKTQKQCKREAARYQEEEGEHFMKVLGTYACLSSKSLDPLRELGYNKRSNQLRVICGCKSRADANKQCQKLGLGHDIFQPNYSAETFNNKEREIAGQGGVFVQYSTDNGNKWISVAELLH